MNAQAMQKGVQQQLDAMDVPIVSEDIIYYINRAQEKFVDEQYVFLRGKYTDQQNIELYQNAQKAIENLRTLISTEVVGTTNINAVTHFDNAKSYDLSNLADEFYYYVRSQTQLESGGKWVNNKLIEQENVQKFVQTKYNSPVFRNYLVLLEGTLMYVFYDTQDGADVYDIALTYIKTPDEVVLENASAGQTTESELPKHTHKDIVDLAVALIVQDHSGSRNPRLQQMEQQQGDS